MRDASQYLLSALRRVATPFDDFVSGLREASDDIAAAAAYGQDALAVVRRRPGKEGELDIVEALRLAYEARLGVRDALDRAQRAAAQREVEGRSAQDTVAEILGRTRRWRQRFMSPGGRMTQIMGEVPELAQGVRGLIEEHFPKIDLDPSDLEDDVAEVERLGREAWDAMEAFRSKSGETLQFAEEMLELALEEEAA